MKDKQTPFYNEETDSKLGTKEVVVCIIIGIIIACIIYLV